MPDGARQRLHTAGMAGAAAGGGALLSYLSGNINDLAKDAVVNPFTPEEERKWGVQEGGEENLLAAVTALGALLYGGRVGQLAHHGTVVNFENKGTHYDKTYRRTR